MKLERIHKIHCKGELDRAERHYKDYIAKNPTATALYFYGTLLIQKKQPGRAVEYLEQSIEKDPDFLPAHVNICAALRKMNLLRKTLEKSEAAERRFMDKLKDGDEEFFSALLVNHGSTYLDLGREAEAEERLRLATELNPKNIDAWWNLSLALLAQHKWAEGWQLYDYGFKSKERRARPYFDEVPFWNGEDLKGKTVLAWGEQGIGDEILFASCLPDLAKKARKVIFDSHPRLGDVFQRSFPNIEVHGARKSDEMFDHKDIDYQIPIGTLPKFFRNSDEEFPKEPYLKADKKKTREWRERIGGQLIVGISWRGGALKTGQVRRSLTLNDMMGTLFMAKHWWPDVKFVSLQYGDAAAEEVEAFNAQYGTDIQHYPAAIEDYSQTADIVGACDLVISVITAIVHLSGAMGIPTWCLVPLNAPWKFQTDVAIWHPSIVSYRQQSEYGWGHATSWLVQDFNEWLRERKPQETA